MWLAELAEMSPLFSLHCCAAKKRMGASQAVLCCCCIMAVRRQPFVSVFAIFFLPQFSVAKMVLLPKWYCCQNGVVAKMVLLPKWYFCQNGVVAKMVLLPKWCCCQNGIVALISGLGIGPLSYRLRQAGTKTCTATSSTSSATRLSSLLFLWPSRGSIFINSMTVANAEALIPDPRGSSPKGLDEMRRYVYLRSSQAVGIRRRHAL